MPNILRLGVDDITDQTGKIDLLTGPLRLKHSGWAPNAGRPGERITETIRLMGQGTQEQLIAAVRDLGRAVDRAREWVKNPWQYYTTWLECSLEAEPGSYSAEAAKHAPIFDGAIRWVKRDDFNFPYVDTGYLEIDLVLERGPWEAVASINRSKTSWVSWGDVWTPGAVYGDQPARLRLLTFHNTTTPCYEFWIGYRETDQGYGDFNPLWELEDGTNGTDASDTSDGTASGGYKVVVNFATVTDWEERSRITLSEAQGAVNWDDFKGRFVVLLRCKVGASTVCGIQLKHGYEDDPDQVAGVKVLIDHTSWKLIELGQVANPTWGYREFSHDYDNPATWEMRIEANRESGSGSLDLDALYLVPADHYAHVEHVGTGTLSDAMLVAMVSPDDRPLVYLGATTQPVAAIEAEYTGLEVPIDLGFLVGAAQTKTAHSLTDQFAAYMLYFSRYSLYNADAL